MTEPLIVCPNCSHSIKLTESLAAPLIESTRKGFAEKLAAKDAEVRKEKEALLEQREKLARDRENIDAQVKEKLAAERSHIVAAEAKKAKDSVEKDLDAKNMELRELHLTLTENNRKLAEAQQVQAEVLKKQRELDGERREFELTIEKRVQASQAEIQAKAKLEAEDTLKQRISQKDLQLASMARQVEDLQRRIEQGSQQTQGEALELELESMLKSKFPADIIEPVGKGEFGGDIIQRVNGALGETVGIILWEFKQTKSWSPSWLSKLRDDQRSAKADFALIVSQALPKEVETFDLIDGVWVAHTRCAIPVAISLRHSLIAMAGMRNAQQGQRTKMEQIYEYLTGAAFRRRIEAAIEKFGDMKDDLDRERKFMARQWAKRETQIVSVIETTAGMYGDLQGIAGKALPGIAALDMPLLEAPELPEQ